MVISASGLDSFIRRACFTAWFIRRYVRRMVQAMRVFAGIRVEAQGKDRIPPGAFIIASKHQSWGDGFATYNQFDDLAVTLDRRADLDAPGVDHRA